MVSDGQLAALAAINFDPGNNDVATVATAIALAESGGNERAHNQNAATRDDSYGLWQINMYGDLGPARRRQFDLKSNADLYDQFKNAQVAGDIWNASGFTPWSTYKSGEYKKFMARATAATHEGGAPATGSTGDLPLGDRISDALSIDPLDAFKMLIDPALKVFDVIIKAGEWVGTPSNWIRIIQVGGGVVLAIVAISVVVNPTLEKATKAIKPI